MEGVLLTSIDLPPTGNEMWITDGEGGLTHLDTREDKSKARRWLLSEQKVGCVSVNPTDPSILLLASNDRTVKYVPQSLVDVLLDTKKNLCKQILGLSQITENASQYVWKLPVYH